VIKGVTIAGAHQTPCVATPFSMAKVIAVPDRKKEAYIV